MAECEQELATVKYSITAEFDDQGVPGTFGPFSTRAAVDSAAVALSGRTDVKKVTISKEFI